MSKKLYAAFLPVLAVAAFAIVPSVAQAGTYYHCVKLTTKTGEYTNSSCTTKSATKKGEYEKKEVPAGSNIPIKSTSGEAKLVSAAGEIICTADTDTGAITGPKSNTETVTFTGCRSVSLDESCQNVGAAEGTIKTNLLATKLLDHGEKGPSGKEPGSGEVWNVFEAKTGKYQAEFECSGVLFRVSGTLSGVITPVNTMTETFKTKFSASGGEQDLKLEYSTDGGEKYTEAIPSEEITEGTSTSEEYIEVRS